MESLVRHALVWFRTADATTWTAVFTGITAIAAALTLVIARQVQHRGGVEPGWDRPLVLRKAHPRLPTHYGNVIWRVQGSIERLWVFRLHMYNRSGVTQTIIVDRLRLLWPLGVHLSIFQMAKTTSDIDRLTLAPHEGGNMPFRVLVWKGTPHRCLISLRLLTLSGQAATYRGLVELTPYDEAEHKTDPTMSDSGIIMLSPSDTESPTG